jgi:hypothetical protein
MCIFAHYSSAERRDALSEPLRRAVEQCDSAQGLQLLVDVDSAWSGVAAVFLDDVRDDYSAQCVVTCRWCERSFLSTRAFL